MYKVIIMNLSGRGIRCPPPPLNHYVMDTCVNCASPSEILKGELCQGCLSEFFVITNKERSKFVVMSQMYYYGRKLDKLTNLYSIYSGTEEKCKEAVKELKADSEIII